MRTKYIDYNLFLHYKLIIHNFLNDSYRVNFRLKEEEVDFISAEKVEQLNSYLQEDKVTLIGMFDNALIGFIWIHKYKLLGEERLHINQIVVSEDYRGQGIAQELINEAENYAVNNGINTIDLNVSEINDKAINMYDYIGFTTDRRLMKKKL